MPIPTDNDFFQRGDFSGFIATGRCRIVERFQPKNAADPVIGPVRGKHFAVIDDPYGIDLTDGHRIDLHTGQPLPRPSDHDYDPVQAAQDAAAGLGSAVTERIDHEYVDGNNRITVGADGAWLECVDVEFAPGQRLWYHWRFCRFDSMPFNDFAMFLAYPDGDTNIAASHIEMLCDVLTLESSPSPRVGSNWSSPWTVGLFDPSGGFKGTLRWMSSNGQSLTGVHKNRSALRFHRPSALLLDNFSIE
ncbi:hypothetical protein [Thiocapsa sp.]|uniref:hypothetical protein n=1 Tax=Thiocapsa sp. TaxID=2024551 RepID=UPI0025F48CF5|nr:hypothetical protein [Thiocapsa sp.]